MILSSFNSKDMRRYFSFLKNGRRVFSLLYNYAPAWLTSFLIIEVAKSAIFFVNLYLGSAIFDKLVDVIYSGGKPEEVYLYIGILLGFNLLSDILYRVHFFVSAQLYYKANNFFSYYIHNKISRLDISKFEDSHFYTKISKIEDRYSYLPAEYVGNAVAILGDLLRIIIAFVSISIVQPLYILILLVTLIPMLRSSIKASSEIWGIWDYKPQIKQKYFSTAWYLKSVKEMKEIKIFGITDNLVKIMVDIMDEFYDVQTKVQKRLLRNNLIATISEYLGYSYVLVDLILRVLSKSLSVGEFIYFKGVIDSLATNLKALLAGISKVYEYDLWLKNFFEVIDSEPEIVSDPNALKITSDVPKIEFKHVYFKYPTAEKFTLEDFSIVINPGEDIAIVGENGAGKSTFVKLLCRFYDVTKGEILIDGVNIKEIDLNSWYSKLSTLFQAFNMYDYTLRENVELGKSTTERISDEELDGVLKEANAGFISKLTNGVDTILTTRVEGGTDLSGGQWQKVALARAFYRDSPILILDEPTSAIDAVAEAEIFNNIQSRQEFKSTIIISHRFSTVRNAHKIYVVEHGKIVESGTHDELMENDAHYAKMFNIQAQGYK